MRHQARQWAREDASLKSLSAQVRGEGASQGGRCMGRIACVGVEVSAKTRAGTALDAAVSGRWSIPQALCKHLSWLPCCLGRCAPRWMRCEDGMPHEPGRVQ